MQTIKFFNEIAAPEPPHDGCCGPCDGGRHCCPCPTACERAEAEGDPLRIWQGLMLAVAICGAFWAFVLAVFA
jgi:hypothetical protein